MQTNDQGPPSTTQEKLSGAAGGSVRAQAGDMLCGPPPRGGDTLDELLKNMHSFADANRDQTQIVTVLSVQHVDMLLNELSKQWTEILVLRAKQPKITHDEARQAAQRLINSHFNNPNQARACIPVRDDDDDILICRYIDQQRSRDKERNG